MGGGLKNFRGGELRIFFWGGGGYYYFGGGE